ncbi:hypothetical protein BDU57DRAFT_522815 [Ampelomyces quisqualis]|uniref:DUF726-domain-containing protein n=1 Tax=Ampelomyces quisqualis TaxID=50730 RepID=A0A6A5QAU0_AMPQU|nr:hypothetical protein BDU57DRAFT_522815 [Ampelomyces quisqualis]
MSSETPADPPKLESESTGSADPPNIPQAEAEYDEFGLPVRRRRARTPVVDGEEEEEFADAITSRSATREKHVAEKHEPPVNSAKEGENVQTQANGYVKSAVQKIERQESAKPTETQDDAPHHVHDSENVHKQDTEPTAETKAETPARVGDIAPPPESKPQLSDASESNAPVESAPERKNMGPASTSVHHQQQSGASVSEYSHQHAVAQSQPKSEKAFDDGGWQTMPSYARYDMYDDDNRLIAKENVEELEDMHGYANVGGAAKGYTRVIMDDDADSVTSMDDNTAYLFKDKSTTLNDDDEAARDPLAQMQTTKNLLTEGQRVAYVGLVRLAIVGMEKKLTRLDRNRNTKKVLDLQQETTKMWAQKMMVRLYGHMDITTSEQVMIEQLADHGVVPADLTPALMQNARVKNPVAEEVDTQADPASARQSISSPRPDENDEKVKSPSTLSLDEHIQSPAPPPYEEQEVGFEYPDVKSPSQLPDSKSLDIDLRWTVMCDLFLVLITDGVYDSRSRELFEQVGKYLSVDWLEICRFEKRITDALEMQEQADKENWNEEDHLKSRAKRARNKRIAFMGIATVGGGLVIGLSAGLLAPLIGAGLAAGFTTIGVAGTSGFLAGAGGAAVITTTGVVTGSTVGVRAANRRTGRVKTFEYRPLHNNKRTNLIITLAGWMNGKVDDVRLPYSTVDPIMGDIYSVLWEPEMLRSMGDTINILATEALTQGLQQVLASTLLTALMSAMTLPLALTKLSYLIDNPWVVSQARADMAGLVLADSLIDRNLGTRPITLVGFSLGARVIFSCLKELAARGAFGLVQNVYMFGTPVVAKNDEYIKARSIIPGRFVNGYATNDWILGYLFRATSGGVMRVAGLTQVQIPTIENINVTELVPGHMAYRTAMPKLLREVGWEVESDEFTEIEDPDPENHEQRQRELINEIEEARKELEKKAAEKERRGSKVSWWKRKKADKKDWEVYDEHSQRAAPIDKDADPAKIAENPIMFDIDAMRKEIAMLAAENKPYDADEREFEIKEIKSTLPPMKIDLPPAPPPQSPHAHLRETKSYNDSLDITATDPKVSSTVNSASKNGTHTPNGRSGKKSFEEYDEFDDPSAQRVEMVFDTSFREAPLSSPPAGTTTTSPLPPLPPSGSSSPWAPGDLTPNHSSRADTSWKSTQQHPERPPLYSAKTAPGGGTASGLGIHGTADPLRNAWADEFEDDFGTEKDVRMSFM